MKRQGGVCALRKFTTGGNTNAHHTGERNTRCNDVESGQVQKRGTQKNSAHANQGKGDAKPQQDDSGNFTPLTHPTYPNEPEGNPGDEDGRNRHERQRGSKHFRFCENEISTAAGISSEHSEKLERIAGE